MAGERVRPHHGAVPVVRLTPSLRGFTEAPKVLTDACTPRAALSVAFRVNPGLREHILDDPGHRRAQVVVIAHGRRLTDRLELAKPMALQARRGGADRSRTARDAKGSTWKRVLIGVARAVRRAHRGRHLARWPVRIGWPRDHGQAQPMCQPPVAAVRSG